MQALTVSSLWLRVLKRVYALSPSFKEFSLNHQQGPLSHVPSAQPHELQAALRQFSAWLSALDIIHSPRLSRLTVPRLEAQVHHAALERVAQAYQHLAEAVRKPDNKYEASSTLLGSERPFGQVHLLRQIFGLEERESE